MIVTIIFSLVVAFCELGVLHNQISVYKLSVDSQNSNFPAPLHFIFMLTLYYYIIGAGGAARTAVRVARGIADVVTIGRMYIAFFLIKLKLKYYPYRKWRQYKPTVVGKF